MKPVLLFILAAIPALAAPDLTPADKKLQSYRDPAPKVIALWPGDGTRADDPLRDAEESMPEKGDDILRISNVTKPTLHVWPAPDPDGRAVIVFPGGGYNILAAQHEGTEVAAWLNRQGLTAFVCKYRVPRRKDLPPHHVALQDAQRAIRLVRTRAAEFGIKPDQVGVLGFSAGGNLSALTIHQSTNPSYEPLDAIDEAGARPDFAVLVYPAYLSADRDKPGPNPLIQPLPHRTDYPPTFLCVAADDRFARGSLEYSLQLLEKKAPAELHVYEKGGHGKGLRKTGYPFSTWTGDCQRWLADLKNGAIQTPPKTKDK